MPEALEGAAEDLLGRDDLTREQFQRVAGFVEQATGIRMPEGKRAMVQARLSRRMRLLGIDDFGAYLAEAFDSPSGSVERARMIDAITTNKTDFFREPDHFDFLETTVVPGLFESDRSGRPLVVWSAGCATGEEPYSIAITLAECERIVGSFEHIVYGTDICRDALLHASRGIYDETDVVPMASDVRRRHLLKSRDPKRHEVRVARHIRKAVHFARRNLLCDPPPFEGKADVIFCRNVIIYFDRPTQERVLSRLTGYLRPGGHLFVGHSEMLHGFGLPFEMCAPTVHRRT